MLSSQLLDILRDKYVAVVATDFIDLMVEEMPPFLLQPNIQWGQPGSLRSAQDALGKASLHCLLQWPFGDSIEAIAADLCPSREGPAVLIELSIQHGQAHTDIVVL